MSRPAFRARWWNEALDADWTAARRRALSALQFSAGAQAPLPEDLAEDALALGFGARTMFPDLPAWEGVLAATLQREWVENGPMDCPWARVSLVVRRGWEHAARSAARLANEHADAAR
jgi:hypothetical protein